MSAITVSNHTLGVVTKGTPHNAATAGATDSCKVPPAPGIPTPFTNSIPSKQLGPGKTTRTFITRDPIVTKRAIISAPSVKAHAGTLKGVKSQTYMDEASMTSGSNDVYAEDSPVCRKSDTTKQNKGNTVGSWIEGDVEAYLARMVEDQKKRCTIVKIDALCRHDTKGARTLGFPRGKPGQPGEDPYYLEVLSDDTIKLTATRVSAIPGETTPTCMYGDAHTAWVFTRTGPSETPRKKELKGDKQVMSRDMLGMWIDEIIALTPKYKTTGDKVNPDTMKELNRGPEADAKAEKDAFGRRVRGGGDAQRAATTEAGRTAGASGGDARAAADAKNKSQTDANKASDKPIGEALNLGVNIIKMLLLFYADRDPVVVQIEASACSGAKKAEFKVLPAGKVKFDLYVETYWKALLKPIKGVADIISKVGQWCGIHAQVKFLEKPGLSLSIEYKELTKDDNGHKKSEANKSWELAFRFDPFLFVRIEVQLPIPTFLAPMGALLAKILRWFGAEGVVFIAGEVNIGPNIAVKINEYGALTVPTIGCTIKVLFEIGIRIRWGDSAEIWASAYVEGTLDMAKEVFLIFNVPHGMFKGSVQFGFRGGAWADVWGWRKSFEFDYKPPNWKHNLFEWKFPILNV